MEEILKTILDKIDLLDGTIDQFRKNNNDLNEKLSAKEAENAKLKKELDSIKDDVESYIQELEEIRKNYGSSNVKNK